MKGSSATVVLVELVGLVNFLEGKAGEADPKVTLETIRSALKSLTVDQFDELHWHGHLYVHMVQAGDLLSIPCGWVVAEKTTAPQCGGVQVSFVRKSAFTEKALKVTLALCQSGGGDVASDSTKLLQKALEVVAKGLVESSADSAPALVFA